jgi:hypothetical protein
MAVQSTETRMEATATSGVTDYVVRHSNGDGTYSNIHVQNDTDLDVYVNGALKALTTDYTVSISSNIATVTFTTAPTAGAEIVIVRKLSLTQGTSYINNDIFDAATLEDALDKLTLQAQQLDESISRSVRFGDTVANAPDPTIDISASERAGKILGFNADGSQFVTSEFFGTYQGTWTDGTVYNPKDIIRTFDQTTDDNYGSLWVAKIQHTASASNAPDNAAPLTGNAYWDVILDTSFFATQTDLASGSSNTATNAAADAEKLAINPEGDEYTLSDGATTGYSALHYAAKAEEYATSATNLTDDTGAAFSPAKSSALTYVGVASGHASTASTKASEAAASAVSAEDSNLTAQSYAVDVGAEAQSYSSGVGSAVTGEYSAREWALGTAVTDGSSKTWATSTTTVAGGLKGAKGYAEDAATSASASENAAIIYAIALG